MTSRHTTAIAVILLVVAGLMSGCSTSDHPAVFSTVDYDAAHQQARDAGKLLIVDATAVWCGPCKMMDKQSWTDGAVETWIAEHAIAVQVDVDKQARTAADLSIEAMPTVIIFKDGVEFDRVVGFQSAEQLMSWFNGVLAGKKSPLGLGALDTPIDKTDARGRYNRAQMLMRAARYDEATDEYIWLWDNMLDHAPEMFGVRLSYMVADMEHLASTHPPARQAFADLRDRTFAAMGTDDADDVDHDLVRDWVRLNEMIGADDDTLAWYDERKTDPRSADLFAPIMQDLAELLVSHDRWADAGTLYRDPVRWVRDRIERDRQIEATMPEPMRADLADVRVFRNESIAMIYAACLAANRDGEALAIADLMATEPETDLSMAVLAAAALAADQPRDVHLSWAEGDQPLRAEIDAALIRLEETRTR